MSKGSNTFGGTVKLSGESEYRKALSNISAQLGVVSSELNKVTTQYGKNNNSMESNAKKSEILNNKLSSQKEKVEVLRQALEKSKEMYGENDTRTLKWQKSLNDAESDILKTTKEIDALGNEFEESGDQASDSANGGYTIFKNVIANLATDAIESALAGLKKLGGAMIDIGKQAVDGFGEFEQLEGGVKKLFGDDVKDTVIANANNAFKTAGMSANEYLETVTGFSKSMIVSLNGDTKKAAQLSDQALKDMSDNANTFGTDMQSIQNAYQGFAKGQFNMLDNLKLGYGGTKTEMQRLLKDAQKLTGQKYDVSNFSDITEAIHAIQVASNIAGTTEAEAMGTIQGSIGALKSSWSNLITGLATDGADFPQLIMNMFSALVGDGNGNGGAVNNVLKTVDKVVDAVFEALPMILDGISEQLPSFLKAGSNIISKLVQGLTRNMPLIINSVMEIINMLISTIIKNLPQILQMGIQMIVTLVQGIAQQLPTLVPQMINALLTMVTTLLDNIDLIIDAGIQLIMGLADGLIEALPDLIDKIPEIIDKLIIAITNNLPKLVEAGITLQIKLAEGLIKAIPQLISKIPQIITSLVKGIANYYGKMLSIGGELLGKVKEGISKGISKIKDVGGNLVKGLWNGINEKKDWILDKIKGFGDGVLKGIKKFFGIHSPSKVFKDEVGSYLAQGIGEGFTEEMDSVNRNIQNSLRSDFEVSPNIKLNTNTPNLSANNIQTGQSTNKNETYNFNFYNTNNSPSEQVRQFRNEIKSLKLGNVIN